MFNAAKIIATGLMQLVSGLLVVCLLLSFVPDNSAPDSVLERFLIYLSIPFSFDFGYSIHMDVPVGDVVGQGAKITFMLLGMSVGLILAIAIPLGLWVSTKKNRATDFLTNVIYVVSAIPVLVWASVLMLLYFLLFNMTPIFSDFLEAGIWSKLFIVSPVLLSLVLGDGTLFEVYRKVKDESQRILNEPWIKGVKTRGGNVSYHLSRGLVEPVYITITDKLTYLFSGIIVVEFIFNWFGLGFIIWTGLMTPGEKDYPVIIAAITVIIIFVVVVAMIRESIKLIMHPEIYKKG